MTVLLVALGAAVGAPTRYLAGHLLDGHLPRGTVVVNLVGSFLLGLFSALALTDHASALLGTGFCGALTTYSTFGYETVRLFEDGARFYSLLNAATSIAAGLGAAFIGVMLAEGIWQ